MDRLTDYCDECNEEMEIQHSEGVTITVSGSGKTETYDYVGYCHKCKLVRFTLYRHHKYKNKGTMKNQGGE